MSRKLKHCDECAKYESGCIFNSPCTRCIADGIADPGCTGVVSCRSNIRNNSCSEFVLKVTKDWDD